MLEHHRRPQSRLEPIVAMPATSTTTTRRTRRLCLNIETNGAGPTRSRRRRRRLYDPYFITYPSVYGGNPCGYGEWCPNEYLYTYENFVDPQNRLNAGEQYECDPYKVFIPPEEEEYGKDLYTNNSGQKTVGDLKNILISLDSYLQEENVKLKSNNNVEPIPIGVQEPHNNQISVLTDLINDTIGRLNTYTVALSKNQELMQMHQLKHLPRVPQPVQVLQLPVQPLIIPPMLSNHSMYPSNHPSAFETAPSQNQDKNHFERLPWLKERKRKRPAKCVTYVNLHSRGCSTDDLDTLPRILEASNLQEIPPKFSSPPMKDAGTTMWCPMECCRGCCGLVRSQEQETPPTVSEIPYPTRLTAHLPLSSLKAPPPTEDEMDGDQEKFYHPSKSIYVASDTPQTSSYSSGCDYHRHIGGNLRYSYVDEEEEEKQEIEPEEEHAEEDEWYRGASNKLAELELEQEYFKEMEKQKQVNTRNQQLQTDPDIVSENSSVNIIITTDKAVSTTELISQPVKIIRMYKRSSLKQRQRLKSGSQMTKSKGSRKVKFEKVQQAQIAPEILTVGRNPMRCEETARSRNRCNEKCSCSSFDSKETRTYRDQYY